MLFVMAGSLKSRGPSASNPKVAFILICRELIWRLRDEALRLKAILSLSESRLKHDSHHCFCLLLTFPHWQEGVKFSTELIQLINSTATPCAANISNIRVSRVSSGIHSESLMLAKDALGPS